VPEIIDQNLKTETQTQNAENGGHSLNKNKPATTRDAGDQTKPKPEPRRESRRGESAKTKKDDETKQRGQRQKPRDA